MLTGLGGQFRRTRDSAPRVEENKILAEDSPASPKSLKSNAHLKKDNDAIVLELSI